MREKTEFFDSSKETPSSTYVYKREFYYELEASIEKSNVVFLLGPRKCGKTVALLQLDETYDNAEYHNFKIMTRDESLEIFDCIKDAIINDLDTIFLLDEITYAFEPEKEINAIAMWLTKYTHSKVKIIFTGSQSVALEAWANRAFCGNVAMVRTDFLSYREWLEYMKIPVSTEETYNRFLYEVDDFYGFVSLEDYLRGCLEETVISNQKTANVIMGNDVYLLDVNTLLDICYATMFTLHNHVTSQGFSKSDKLSDAMYFYFRDVCKQIGSEEIGNRITNSFIGRYNNFRTRDLDTLKQAFLFLWRAGLITITPVSDNVENVPNVLRDLMSSDSKINYKDELFKNFNVCIRYPMFYMAILKDVLGKEMPEHLPTALLGSIVECHVRGILPEAGAFEFKDMETHEIDYVNVRKLTSVEITVSNKRSGELNFRYLPNGYTHIVLTKDKSGIIGYVMYIPYHTFLAENVVK